jgi:hypothetical protein
MLKRKILLLIITSIMILLFYNSAIADEPNLEKARITCKTEYKVIGCSFSGTKINSVIITPENYNKTILLTFAMHGFEDAWSNDGGSLVVIANDIIKEFSSKPESLNKTKLIIIPCVNPDGTWYGLSGDGFGRCNAQGIDINRDFDYYWKPCYETKYRTGEAPFSTPEARMLRNVVMQEKPDIVIDFHGWLNLTYGDKELGELFGKVFNMPNSGTSDKNKIYMQQYFTGWASQYARTLMVEYPNPGEYNNLVKWEYSKNTINALKILCNSKEPNPK